MEITVNSQLLAQELRLLSKVVADKPALPVLSNVLFEAEAGLRMSATDFELCMRCECKATVSQMGSITLPSKKLLDLVEQLPDADVRLVYDPKRMAVRISCGSFNSHLQALPAEDFPALPEVEGTAFALPSVSLRFIIARTRYAIADNKQKHFLSAALLSLSGVVMAMVTTDGKRLALATAGRPSDPTQKLDDASALLTSAIIPHKTLDVLSAHDYEGLTKFSATHTHLFFVMGERVLISRTLDGKFPAYERIIQTAQLHDKTAVLERAPFAAALRRVGLTAPQAESPIFATFEPGVLLITSSSQVGDADERLPIAYTGEPIKLCLNWKFLLDFLNAATSQTVKLEMKDTFSPVLLTDGTDYLNVVMAMRI